MAVVPGKDTLLKKAGLFTSRERTSRNTSSMGLAFFLGSPTYACCEKLCLLGTQGSDRSRTTVANTMARPSPPSSSGLTSLVPPVGSGPGQGRSTRHQGHGVSSSGPCPLQLSCELSKIYLSRQTTIGTKIGGYKGCLYDSCAFCIIFWLYRYKYMLLTPMSNRTQLHANITSIRY